jgi:hypothetical protein
VSKIKELDYTDRLRALQLPSLYYRRCRGDMIEVYKYVHQIYELESIPLEFDENPASTSGHSFNLKKQRCNKTATQKFFKHRVIDPWNSLPDDVVTAPSMNSFKNRLDAHWKDRFYDLRKPQK